MACQGPAHCKVWPWRACQDRGTNCSRRSQLEAPQLLLDRVQLGDLCKRLHDARSGITACTFNTCATTQAGMPGDSGMVFLRS